MSDEHQGPPAKDLAVRFRDVRGYTEALAGPLSPEDQTIQSMPDVSPTKWHRAHTTWFFETFLLEPYHAGYRAFHPAYAYLFNSYYETVGSRHPRAERGLLSRPGVGAIGRYRRHVDEAMEGLLSVEGEPAMLDLVELGLHHENQHQELLLMDIKHVLSCNPLQPSYRTCAPSTATAPVASPAPGGAGTVPSPAAVSAESGSGRSGWGRWDWRSDSGWIDHGGGDLEIGHQGGSFAFDNEEPRHVVHLTPFALAPRPVTCGDWLEFMEDDGYHRSELWLSDGWTVVQQEHRQAPLYWSNDRNAGEVGGDWTVFTLNGPRPVDPDEPVCHVSYYEADAFAHWTGARLPTESEWETVAVEVPAPGCEIGDGPPPVHPRPVGPLATTGHTGAGHTGAGHTGAGHTGPDRMGIGEVWEWTASSYSPYPGFRAPAGAVGEYNGKFMVNQYVLRGGCAVTPPGHSRPTYRNFFPAGARWAFSGLRLCKDR